MVKPESKPDPGGKRSRTRKALVDAMLAIVSEQDFAHASLADVAARAGMSTGAIYSNFSGKAELLYEAMASKTLVLAPDFTPGAPLKAQLRAVGEALIRLLPRAMEEARFVAEYYLYAIGDADLAARNRAWYSKQFDALGALIERDYGAELNIPVRVLTVTAQCLALGFVDQYARTPGEITDEVILTAFEVLADGAVK
jgi:AcrR family transcriptional regulator